MTGARALTPFPEGGSDTHIPELPRGFDPNECGAVGRQDIGGWYCSGVLVDPRVALTVAHCGPRGGRAIPRAFILRTRDLLHPEGAEILEGRFVAHEAFMRRGQAYDIAMMLLDRPSTVQPVALASTAEISAAREVTMVGFGCEREELGPSLRFRRAITSPIHFFADGPLCSVRQSVAAASFNPDVEFLAGSEDAGPCFGDSGGPAYIFVAGKRKLAGIISRPAAREKPFCKGPMILTRADVFEPWIAGHAELLTAWPQDAFSGTPRCPAEPSR